MTANRTTLILQLRDALASIRIGDVLDMIFVSTFIYLILLWFKRTKAVFVARGIMILAVFYFIARQLGMVLTTWIFHGFFAIFLIALVVIFQEELRHFFERLAMWRWHRHSFPPTQPAYIEDIIRSILLLARERVGALIVIRGTDPLERHLDGGHELNGLISSPLIESIFDPHSDGHDGAIVVEGNRVARFAVHLPLSKDAEQVAGHGTRHAAALGLAEMTDALCLVVSEQKGTISVAYGERLIEVVDRAALEKEINAFLRTNTAPKEQNRWNELFVQHLNEKVLAIVFAVVFWLVFVKNVQPLRQVVK